MRQKIQYKQVQEYLRSKYCRIVSGGKIFRGERTECIINPVQLKLLSHWYSPGGLLSDSNEHCLKVYHVGLSICSSHLVHVEGEGEGRAGHQGGGPAHHRGATHLLPRRPGERLANKQAWVSNPSVCCLSFLCYQHATSLVPHSTLKPGVMLT